MVNLEHGPPVRILALGDSLTAGYGVARGAALPDVLRELLAGQGHDVEMINAGVSGDTAEGGLARLPGLMGRGFEAALVEFGTNEAFMGIEPGQVRRALDGMIRRLKAGGAEVMLVGARALTGEGPDYAARFARIYDDLAAEHGLILYPFVLEGVLGDPGLTQWDGLHPNERGVRIMAERMLPRVLELVRRVSDKRAGVEISPCESAAPGLADEYAGLAGVYDFLTDPFLRGMREAVARRIADLGFSSILDVACGTGRQLEALSGQGLRLTGIDASRAMLEAARTRTSGQIGYVFGDAADMPFAGASFDGVSVCLALHEMDGTTRASAVREALRVLRPGGRLLIVDYAGSGGRNHGLFPALAGLVERAAGSRHFKCYKDFLAGGGTPGLARGLGLEAVHTGSFLFGTMGLFEIAAE